MTETLSMRCARMQREAAAAARGEALRHVAREAATAAPRPSPATSPAQPTSPNSAAPAAAYPAPAIVDRGAIKAKERPVTDQMTSPLKRTEVELSTPILWFDKLVSKVTLKEPTAAEFFRIGEPEVFVGNGKSASCVEVPEALEAYIAICLDVEVPHGFLAVLNIRDGRAIKRALLGFFRAAPEAAPA